MSRGCQTGSEMNRRRGQGKEGERRQKRKEERPYHDNKHLMMIISSGDVMHADVVMQAGLRRNMSISALVSLFAKAAAGGYAAKSFTEHKVQLGFLFLQLGGN